MSWKSLCKSACTNIITLLWHILFKVMQFLLPWLYRVYIYAAHVFVTSRHKRMQGGFHMTGSNLGGTIMMRHNKVTQLSYSTAIECSLDLFAVKTCICCNMQNCHIWAHVLSVRIKTVIIPIHAWMLNLSEW